MARTKLKLPDLFQYETELTVRITDINYGGHLGNDSVAGFIHEARVRFLKEHGFSELDAGGPGMIQSDAVIIFRAEAFYGDTISVKVAVEDITNTGCDFYFLMSDKKTGKEVVRAKTGIIFYDYTRKKIARTSEQFIAKVKSTV